MSGFHSTLQKAQAKRLRQAMTPAERVLWHHLRAHRFMGLSVRRQAPIGRFIVNFLIPDHRLIIEADCGGQCDSARTLWLCAKGFRVLRLLNGEVLTDLPGCLDRIAAAVSTTSSD
jgi:very-short-patch-repair endonuclease